MYIFFAAASPACLHLQSATEMWCWSDKKSEKAKGEKSEEKTDRQIHFLFYKCQQMLGGMLNIHALQRSEIAVFAHIFAERLLKTDTLVGFG